MMVRRKKRRKTQRTPPKPPQPQPRPRPRKGWVMHAQSAFRTYICSNLNLCTLPMSLSIPRTKKKKYYDNISNVLLIQRKKTLKEAAAATTKKKKRSKVCGASSNSNTICINVHNRHDFYFIVSPSKSQNHKYYYKTKRKKTSKISYYRHNYQQTLAHRFVERLLNFRSNRSFNLTSFSFLKIFEI